MPARLRDDLDRSARPPAGSSSSRHRPRGSCCRPRRARRRSLPRCREAKDAGRSAASEDSDRRGQNPVAQERMQAAARRDVDLARDDLAKSLLNGDDLEAEPRTVVEEQIDVAPGLLLTAADGAEQDSPCTPLARSSSSCAFSRAATWSRGRMRSLRTNMAIVVCGAPNSKRRGTVRKLPGDPVPRRADDPAPLRLVQYDPTPSARA